MLAAAWMTAIGTGVLAVGAIITALFAFLAFRQQASEIAMLQQQARDQSEQLEFQRRQYVEQHEVSLRQTAVLDLQARELAGSLADAERQAAERRRAQASRVHFWDERNYLDVTELRRRHERPGAVAGVINSGEWHAVAHVKNNSDLAIWGLLLQWHLGAIPIGKADEVPQLAAGQETTVDRKVDPGDGELRFEADLTFRDSAGITWRRKIRGELEEIPGSATLA